MRIPQIYPPERKAGEKLSLPIGVPRLVLMGIVRLVSQAVPEGPFP